MVLDIYPQHSPTHMAPKSLLPLSSSLAGTILAERCWAYKTLGTNFRPGLSRPACLVDPCGLPTVSTWPYQLWQKIAGGERLSTIG